MQLPHGWSTCTLSDIAAVNPKTVADESLIAGFVPMSYAPTSYHDELLFDEKPWGEIKKSYTNFQDGDVIFAKVTPCFENGKAAIVDDLPNGIGAGSSEFYVLRPHCNDISQKLLFALIKTHAFMQEGATNMTGAVGLRRVPKSFVEKFPIALPPAAEQKEIADRLDKLLAQVEATQARLAHIPDIIKRFRQSVLAAAVSGKLTEEWRVEKTFEQLPNVNANYAIDSKYIFEIPSQWKLTAIGNCAAFQQGLQIAKATRRTEPDHDVLPILRTVNYENGFSDDVHYVLVDDKSIIAEQEDIIISRTGTVGRVLTGYRGIMHNNTFRINYDKTVLLREYLIYFLKSPICQEYVKENSGRSSQPDLTHKAFAKCPLTLPSIMEQTEIVRRVEQLFAYADTIEQQAKAAKERVDKLTQAILAKAFRGELTADWRAANPELISGDNSAAALLARIQAERAAAKPRKNRRV
ncbi:restriction endonuclease subunit S [Aeromonas sp. A-5]|uniref:restriction endonuclease subunit S n=1 Tax=Aeromonas ichthyocola TaxID=3367746 RepID=UPI0038F15D96